jgi:hypothetical protein
VLGLKGKKGDFHTEKINFASCIDTRNNLLLASYEQAGS